MKKEEVLALIADKKTAAVVVFDDISAAVDSIEITVTGGGDEDLQKQIADLTAALQAKSDELEALKAVEASEHVDLDNVKADLEVVKAKLEKDEIALGKFKAILAALTEG